ncbi:MAG: Gfo/Idh/MocA family oxidoreductase [Isosphaeraceae bacterium]
MDKLKIAVVGAGYWGPNLIRNFMACPLTEVAAVCDSNPQRIEAVSRNLGQVRGVGSLDELLELPLDAVAIATPVSTHYELATRCLDAGLHVLVEKPLAGSVREAQALVAQAERLGLVLMVDHTYLFSNAVRRIKELIDEGALGELYYVDSIRINLGLFQHDTNVIWDLAPHDLSIVDYILGGEARSISAWGCAHAAHEVEDVAYVNVDYGDRLMANFHVNWLSPVKIRQMIFAGSRKSLVFNEMSATEPVKVYDRGIELGEGADERRKLLISYRSGDIWSPYIEPGEALQGVVGHFAGCIRDGKTPLSDGRLGLRVIRMLEAANRSIRAQGGRVVLSNGGLGNAGDTRAQRPGQRDQDLAGRPAGTRRDHALLR